MTNHLDVPWIRSMLYVPGNRPDWMSKALSYAADALVLDLEDSVPADEKVAARGAVAAFLHENNGPKPILVRINEPADPAFLRDVEAIACPGLTGIVVPKVQGPRDIHLADQVLGWVENEVGLPPGRIAISPVLETATGIRNAHEIARSSPRVAYTGGLGVKGGDVERALGYRWTRQGRETFTLRAQTLLDVRAAGVPNPMTGLWTDVNDVDGLRAFATQSRELGYEGMAIIHPSHADIVNATFSVTELELDYYRRLVGALEEAEADRRAAVTFEGEMVDIAMLKTARQRLDSVAARTS